jgi:predicted DNA-binding protein
MYPDLQGLKTYKTTSLRIEEEKLNILRNIAKKQDRSVNYLINDIITNHINIYYKDSETIL